MSLMDRVREAGMMDAPASSGALADELRERVSAILPPPQLAQLAQENPRQAEGEIRSACEQVFQECPWLIEGAQSADDLVDAFVNNVFGLGPLEPYLADDTVTEIMVNGIKSFYVERGGVNVACPVPFADEDAVRALVDRIIGPLGRRIDESAPMVDARLASGHRVNAVIPPIALDGPTLTIRKFSEHVLGLADLVSMGTLSEGTSRVLTWAVAARKNIAVSGGTGTGKSTLLNALSCEIAHSERIVTIEDSAELRFLEHPHVVRMEARPVNAEGKGEITIRDLVKNALRMRPDRIIVGEVRGGEALDMLNAMNTGHDGSATTLHANSPADAIMRLATMVRFAADLPIDAIEAQVGSALDVIVQLARYRDGSRKVSHICEVNYDREEGRCRVTQLYVRNGLDDAGEWLAAPAWFDEAMRDGVMTDKEVKAWMQSVRLLSPAA